MKILYLIATVSFCIILSTSIQTITPREGDVFKLDSIDRDGDRLVSMLEFKRFIQKLEFLISHYTPKEIEDLSF